MRQHTYVRRYRKRWALSQEELALLLKTTQSIISRCEVLVHTPDIRTVLGLQVVFGKSPRALFPGLYHSIEEQVMREAARLDKALEGKSDPDSRKKRQLLATMIERAAPPQA